MNRQQNGKIKTSLNNLQSEKRMQTQTKTDAIKKEVLQKETIRKVLSRIKKYQIYLIGSLLFTIITVAGTLYLPILTGNAVDQMIDSGMVEFDQLFYLLRVMGGVILITAISQWLTSLCNNRMTYLVVRDIRKEAFEKLEILPLKYADNHPTGEIVSRVISDVDQFADGLLMGFTQLFSGVLTIAGTLYFMISVNIVVALVVIMITPVSLLVASFIAKRTYTMFQKQSEVRGEQTAFIDEMIGNQKVVQVFSKQDDVARRFSEINDQLEQCSLRATFFSSLTNPCTRFVNSLVYTGVAISGALAVLSGYMSVGQMSAFLSYANQYTKPFNEISGVVTELQNAIACAARIFELIEEEPQIADDTDAVVIQDASGEVTLDDVSFSYTDEQSLIKDFNLHVHPGQRIAIVGPTGCGKTTIINLLMRFYDVKEGKIAVMGEDIRHITRDSLRASYGMVLQETWLKSGTIKENLSMGKPDANMDEIIQAAKASHAHSFIMKLPNGYDTVIGEDGGALSQGQKQLLCIARVMLSLPPMLILDEATSSIDTRTELKIQNAFSKMMQGKTTFIVAHRLSTIKEADVILVMKDGNIIEQGDHNSLLKQGGFYAELYRLAK